MAIPRIIVTTACLFALVGCGEEKPAPSPAATKTPAATAMRRAPVSPPQGVVIYQPSFSFADGQTTQQGTGFLVRSSGGEVLGVTSAHFIDFEGAAMLESKWTSVADGSEVAAFQYSVGPPGRSGTTEPLDLRSDYLIVAGDHVNPSLPAFDLDPRVQPNVGEHVWFPNKDHRIPDGHALVGGVVAEASDRYVFVQLDHEITLQSQSGSPIISQQTGKVIGTLAKAANTEGTTFLILCPSHSISRQIEQNADRLPLREAIGRPGQGE